MEYIEGLEYERLVARELNEDFSLEQLNTVRKFMEGQGPVSHYNCSYASSDEKLVFVWENEYEPGENPDLVGCTVCSVMTELEETLGGEELWKAEQYF